MDPFLKVLEASEEVDLRKTEGPTESVKSYERVIGILPERLRRLYVATCAVAMEILPPIKCDKIHKRVVELQKKDAQPENHPEDIALIQGHVLDHRIQEWLMQHFWIEVEREFVTTHLHDRNIGLRQGWKVVTW